MSYFTPFTLQCGRFRFINDYTYWSLYWSTYWSSRCVLRKAFKRRGFVSELPLILKMCVFLGGFSVIVVICHFASPEYSLWISGLRHLTYSLRIGSRSTQKQIQKRPYRSFEKCRFLFSMCYSMWTIPFRPNLTHNKAT